MDSIVILVAYTGIYCMGFILYFFASNSFGSGYFYRLVQIHSLFLLLSLALFSIVRECDEVIK